MKTSTHPRALVLKTLSKTTRPCGPQVAITMREQIPPPSRTKWTRRVPHPVLIGHAASLSQVAITMRERLVERERARSAQLQREVDALRERAGNAAQSPPGPDRLGALASSRVSDSAKGSKSVLKGA